MNTNNKHPHFSRTVLHNGEERVKRIFRDQLAELAGLLEVGISLLVVVALMLAVVPLIKMLPGLLVDTNQPVFAARAGYRHRHRVHQDACQAQPRQCAGSAAVCHCPPYDRWA